MSEHLKVPGASAILLSLATTLDRRAYPTTDRRLSSEYTYNVHKDVRPRLSVESIYLTWRLALIVLRQRTRRKKLRKGCRR